MPWLQAVNPTSIPRSDKLESPIHHDFSCVGQRLATCIFATTTGEITLPAFVKDYEDVFSETEAGMLSQSMLIRTRDRRISLCNLPEKELKIFTHSSSLFQKKGLQLSLLNQITIKHCHPLPLVSETLDRSPPLRRKLHDHNRIRIRKPISAFASLPHPQRKI